MPSRPFAAVLALGLIAAISACASTLSAEETPMEDPYLWLEDIDGERALDWVRAENARTFETLQADPRFDVFKRDALEILSAEDRIPMPAVRNGMVYNFWQDEAHVRGIWRRAGLESYRGASPDWEVLLDIDALGEAEGKSWVYKGVDCFPSGFTRCLVSLSDGGRDAVEVREFDVETKAFVEGGFRFGEARQFMVWQDADTLIAASPLSDEEKTGSGYPRIVRRLVRGQALADAPVVFEGARDDVGSFPAVLESKDRRIPLIVRSPSFFTQRYFVLGEGEPARIPLPEDATLEGLLGDEAIVTLRSDWAHEGATHPQGAVVSFSWDAFVESGKVGALKTLFSPEARVSVQRVSVGPYAAYLTLLDNVTGRIERLGLKKGMWNAETLALPGRGDLSLVAMTPYSETAFALYDGFLQPDSLYEIDGAVSDEPLKSLPRRFVPDGLAVAQYEAVSADGTKIPYFLVRRSAAEEPVPTLIYGYGGFEVSQKPGYSGVMGKLWLEKGGAYVLANIRGGGEFGPAWHQAALRENRQRAFDDFIAVAEDLVARGLAQKRGLGIMGGSNGGLLVGAALTQRPNLYGAAVIQVPLLDMLRYHTLLAGASWMEEYGDPDLPEDRAVLSAYSPYQQLDPQADYPLTFIYTSTRDDRVHPGHARKFAARMKEQGHGVLYFERIEGGHGAGADLLQAAERLALEYTYLHRQLLDGAE